MRRLLIAVGFSVALAGGSVAVARPAMAQAQPVRIAQGDADRSPVFSLCIRSLIHKAIDLPFPLPNLFNDPIPEKTLSLEFGGHNPDCK